MEMNNNNKPQATKVDVMNRQQLIKRIVVASWEKDLSQEFAEAYKQVRHPGRKVHLGGRLRCSA